MEFDYCLTQVRLSASEVRELVETAQDQLPLPDLFSVWSPLYRLLCELGGRNSVGIGVDDVEVIDVLRRLRPEAFRGAVEAAIRRAAGMMPMPEDLQSRAEWLLS